MADITPEEIKNTADALWAVLRKENPETDLQALAACVVMVLGATRPEGRSPLYKIFTQLLADMMSPILSGGQDPDEWLERATRH